MVKLINKINHFPSPNEIKIKKGLYPAICRCGGTNKFRKLMNYKLVKNSSGYWTHDITLKELKETADKIGHFPSIEELKSIGRRNICDGISMNGGYSKFRTLLGYELLQKPVGYWTDEIIIDELKQIISKIGHFPSHLELKKFDKGDLANIINRSDGGYFKYHELCGFNVSDYDKYISELLSYIVRRGKSSENIVKEILKDYCLLYNLSEPIYNKKLCKGNVLEFICNTNKIIGIDVTNTKNKGNIYHKWLKKDYHKYLDELWIVVFSNIFKENDYIELNTESPSNVKVMSIYSFLKELDYSIDEQTKTKIDKYNSCTFHTKEELINKESN